MISRLLAIISIALCCAPICAAHADPPAPSAPTKASDASVLVPADDKARHCVDVLQHIGIDMRGPVSHVERGPAARLSVYDMAAGIASITSLLKPIADNAPKKSKWENTRTYLRQRLMQNPEALDALLTLVYEFAPELKALKRDPEAIEASLLVMQSDGQAAAGNDHTLAARVPADHWAYQAIDSLTKAGILFGYHFGGTSPWTDNWRSMDRYEFAVSIARLGPLLQPVGTPLVSPANFYLVQYANQNDLDESRRAAQKNLQHDSQAAGALAALVKEFKPELILLHVDVQGLQAKVKHLQVLADASQSHRRRITGQVQVLHRVVTTDEPFSDVPPTHWAYQSVETLRKAGIMMGYPDNHFRTN